MLSWQQPLPSGALRTVEMPCPEGCGGEWRHPAAERDRVIDQRGDDSDDTENTDDRAGVQPRQGNAEEANNIGADFIREALEHWGFLDERGRGAGGHGSDR